MVYGRYIHRCPNFPWVGWLREGLEFLAHEQQAMMTDGIPNWPLYFYQKRLAGLENGGHIHKTHQDFAY